MSRDNLYSHQEPGVEPFRFDASVASVFPDMLRRSIPGYSLSLQVAGSLARRFVTDDSRCYDLGCSLGAVAIAMRQGITRSGCEIIAVDNAPAMVERCREVVERETRRHPGGPPISVYQDDIRNTAIENASLVALNYTLQFLPPGQRSALVGRIYTGLRPGGVLMLSEKTLSADPVTDNLLSDLHHEFKRRNDYSAMEVARKRAALENVLIPETEQQHRERLHHAGFTPVITWLRHFNFVSMIALRP